MPLLKISPAISGDFGVSLIQQPNDPVVRRFLQLAYAKTAWRPGWPRRLLRLIAWLQIAIYGPRRGALLLTGFCVPAVERAAYIVKALVVILREWRQRRQYIYRDGRPLLVLGDGEPRQRFGAPSWALRPQQFPSPAAASEASPPTPQPPPPRPAGPITPSATYLTRRS
jgi:hypothetical protein